MTAVTRMDPEGHTVPCQPPAPARLGDRGAQGQSMGQEGPLGGAEGLGRSFEFWEDCPEALLRALSW